MTKKIAAIFLLIIIFIFAVLFFPKKENHQENDNFYETTLEEKIGEMLILGFRGLNVDESSKIIKDINNYNIGGVILFDYDVPSRTSERNIKNPEQTKKLIEDIKKLTKEDLLIAIDVEGGYVNRLNPKYGFIELESAQTMGKDSREKTKSKALPIGAQLAGLGVNLNFAPVVDVNINPKNPIIGKIERSFSNDPEKVYLHAKSFIEAMHEYKIMTAIKHFPGHGSSEKDSHLGLTDITKTYQKEIELLPYKKLVNDNLPDMIMTAHVINKEIDKENPATLSPAFLQKILRNELNFKGVIVSDDMQMGAIVDYFGFEEAIIRAINAGCDLLIFSNNNREYDEDIAEKAFKAIKKAIEKGEISEERINDSFNRIKKLKEKY